MTYLHTHTGWLHQLRRTMAAFLEPIPFSGEPHRNLLPTAVVVNFIRIPSVLAAQRECLKGYGGEGKGRGGSPEWVLWIARSFLPGLSVYDLPSFDKIVDISLKRLL